MAITKVQSEGINLADDFTFTGTVAGTVTNTPAFQAYKSSSQSIGDSAETKVTFDTETLDTDSAFASSTFTVPSGKNGKYFIYAQLQLDTGSGATFFVSIFKNGAEVFAKRMTSDGANRKSPAVSAVISLVATDTVDIYTYQNSGTSKDVDGANKRTHFGGYKLVG